MMTPTIRALYLRLDAEWSGNRADIPPDDTERLKLWSFDAEDIAYMEQIRTIDDLLNYQDDGSGKMCALAYDCALAMGLSEHDAMSVAGDI